MLRQAPLAYFPMERFLDPHMCFYKPLNLHGVQCLTMYTSTLQNYPECGLILGCWGRPTFISNHSILCHEESASKKGTDIIRGLHSEPGNRVKAHAFPTEEQQGLQPSYLCYCLNDFVNICNDGCFSAIMTLLLLLPSYSNVTA